MRSIHDMLTIEVKLMHFVDKIKIIFVAGAASAEAGIARAVNGEILYCFQKTPTVKRARNDSVLILSMAYNEFC